MTAINATGKVKWYQIIVGGLLILNLPLSYIALELGFCVESTAFIALMLCLIALFARLIICKRIIGLKLTDFFNTVLSPILKVTILASILPFVISQLLEDNIYTLFWSTLIYHTLQEIFLSLIINVGYILIIHLFNFDRLILNLLDTRSERIKAKNSIYIKSF
jgi:hypothetical protein